MKVTEVRIFFPRDSAGAIKAYASVTFDNCFVVKDMKVISGEKGVFVAMPNRRVKEDEYRDVAYPINKTFHAEIENAVLDEYERQINKGGA